MSGLKMDVEYLATDGDSKDVALLIPFMSAGSSTVNREAENPSACVKVSVCVCACVCVCVCVCVQSLPVPHLAGPVVEHLISFVDDRASDDRNRNRSTFADGKRRRDIRAKDVGACNR